MRVLIVEDDQALANPLVEGLHRYGIEARHVTTGREAVDLASSVDLILLDLGLPDMDGVDVCRAIRRDHTVPIIVLTARGDEIDRVLLLEMGADDYVVKPFGFRELVARIGAVTRRALPQVPSGSGAQVIGSLRIDRERRRAFVADAELELSPKEFDLLSMLAERPGAVRTREDIIDQVWDPHWFGPTKTLDVHVSVLRRKLGNPAWIETVRGVGYRLEVPE